MRAVVQRVMKASVSVDDEVISSIGRGVCILLGISRDDNHKDMDWMINKILKLRIFEDDSGARWKKGVQEKQLEILCVSQFTLTCTLKGNKPDFHTSMEPTQSQTFYEDFLQRLRTAYKSELVKDGKFAAYMQVSIQNDGPVTIQLDTPAQQTKNDNKKTNKQKEKQNPPASSENSTLETSASGSDLASDFNEKVTT